MRHRPCLDCAALTRNRAGRCDDCHRTTTARGYGNTHRKLRAQWKPHVDTGTIACARCGHLIALGQPWDLGHDDNDRNHYNGPEHTACNRGARPQTPSRIIANPRSTLTVLDTF